MVHQVSTNEQRNEGVALNYSRLKFPVRYIYIVMVKLFLSKILFLTVIRVEYKLA